MLGSSLVDFLPVGGPFFRLRHLVAGWCCFSIQGHLAYTGHEDSKQTFNQEKSFPPTKPRGRPVCNIHSSYVSPSAQASFSHSAVRCTLSSHWAGLGEGAVPCKRDRHHTLEGCQALVLSQEHLACEQWQGQALPL